MLIKKLTKGYVSHIPPLGYEAHSFWAQYAGYGQEHIVGQKA